MGIRVLMVLLVLVTLTLSAEGLKVGFYASVCPGKDVEGTIRRAVQAKFNKDKTITPGLLRMFFHDCFVQGCDASILIKSKGGNTAEKDAGSNLTVHGYDLIDTAKAAVEKICPGKVSCADIIALATRDAVKLVEAYTVDTHWNCIDAEEDTAIKKRESGGPSFSMPTGRRDGRVSQASQVNLPGPTMSVAQATSAFAAKGLTQNEMVTLLGAHTVGVTHCSFFSDRLWNFQGTGKADPAMDPALVTNLKKTCPQNGAGLGKAVSLDQGTPTKVDKIFYQQLVSKRGILKLDQDLATDRATSQRTTLLAGSRSPFTSDFVAALIKLGSVGVKEGTNGEIRKICSAIN